MDLTLHAGDLSAVSSDPHWIGGIEYDQSFVVNLPSLAAAAFAQKKINARGKSVQQIYEEARIFAQTEYVSALQQGAALPAATRDRVASHLSYLIGLPASVIAEANLRVQSQDFLDALVPNYVVSRLDSRLKGPKVPATTGRIRAADDPALHLNKANIRTNAWVADYLRKDVGVKTDQEYVSLNLDVNSAWDWNSGSSSLEDNIVGIDPAPNIGTFMRGHPKTQLLLVSGYYDVAVPALAQSYVLSHAGIPLKRTKIALFPSGHEVYEDPESRKDVEKEVREFVSLVTE
jgi:carboxypeptidase C (cathepsin A)